MTEERAPYNVLQRELELTQCKLRSVQLDIQDLRQENRELKEQLARLQARIGEDLKKSDTEYF